LLLCTNFSIFVPLFEYFFLHFMRFLSNTQTLLITVLSFFLLNGFQCGSPEMEGAKLAKTQKNYPRAQELLEKEVTNNPKNEDAWFLLGQIHFEMNNINAAVESFKKAKSVGSAHTKDINNFLLSVWAKSLNEGAMSSQRALQVTGDSVEIYKQIAVQSFQNALTVNPDSLLTYRNLGIAYFSTGQRDSGYAFWRNGLRKEKNVGLAIDLVRELYNEGGRYRDEMKAEKAKEYFQQTISQIQELKSWQTKPDESILAQADELLLTSYLEIGDTTTAMLSYEQSIKTDPSNKINRLNFGILLMKAEKFDLAGEQFSAAVQLDPEWEEGNLAAGELYLKVGMKMRDDAMRKKETSKQKDAAMDTTYKAKVRKAVEHLERFTAKNATNAGAWTNLGTAYVLVDGNDKRGKVAYEKADALRK